ncbi:MAG: alpha/beta hydrolase [bacterium]|nr:alpha/beta hydrolase [bacterium]
MKNAILLHGTGGSPKLYWFPYLIENLKKKGYSVWAPQLPNAKKPNLEDWLPFVFKNGKFNKNTVFVGHSAGSQLILSILENINVKINKAILVSGYAEPLLKNSRAKNKSKFAWKKIKKHAGSFIFINSDNDPWECTDKQGKIMLDQLGGTLVIPKGQGHMGSTTYKQPYKKFPLLVRLACD